MIPVSAVEDNRLTADQNPTHRRPAGYENPGIKPVIARADSKIRMIVIQQHKIRPAIDLDAADGTSASLSAPGKRRLEQISPDRLGFLGGKNIACA